VQVHQAADGCLARVRIPGGVLTSRQWQALVDAAHELGNGQLELTSRGNVQLRGLAPGAEQRLTGRLADAGLLPSLSHERVRNLLASPLTGRAGAGVQDVRALICEFDQALCARPGFQNLSGRFLFALDDGRGDVLAVEPDIAVTAVSPNAMQLLIAGQAVGAEVPTGTAVSLMLAAAEAFLAQRQAEGGTAWRVAELFQGPAQVAAGLGLSCQPVRYQAPAPGLPSQHEVPGVIRQRDGANAVIIGVPLGSLTATQAGALVATDALTARELILTPWRSIVLPDLTDDQATELLARSSRLGLIIDASSPLLGVTACTGRPGCASALADVRADAATAHGAGGPTSTAVHWSGCARRCGRPAMTVTDLVATGSGYRLYNGDQASEFTELAKLSEISTVLAAAR
jgi:precorrin-3B synthase